MAQLSIAQRTFIVKTFYETGSLQETRNQFRERFPERPNLALSTIWYNVRKFEQNGTSLNCNKGNSGRRRTGRSAENIELVRNRLAEHPTGTSARRNGVGIPSATFNRITRLDLRQHPYCMHVRHELLPRDFQRRLNFARWLTERCRRNENFPRNFVVGDEATFCMNGRVNSRNVRAYAPAGNPPAFNYDVSCSRQKWTVWLGLCGSGQVIGPFFFERSVNGINYLQMINTDVLPQLLQHFEMQVGGAFRHLWWVQDGAPAHRLRAVTARLRELFGNRVIALHHAVEWPPRSPDLTPCDFFLWGYLKAKVYASPPNDLNDLQARIRQEVALLANDPAMVRRAVQGILRRCQTCIDRNGGHVEGIGA